MSTAQITLNGKHDRDLALKLITEAPVGTRVLFKVSKRTLPQNQKMWICLTEVAAQLDWDGHKLDPDEWKILFMDALHREMKIVRSLDGKGFVNLGRSSSRLEKEDFSDLIELIHAFGANHGVKFRDDTEQAA